MIAAVVAPGRPVAPVATVLGATAAVQGHVHEELSLVHAVLQLLLLRVAGLALQAAPKLGSLGQRYASVYAAAAVQGQACDGLSASQCSR